jgi:hypothetical protein
MRVRITAEDALCAVNVAALQMLRKVANGRAGDHGGTSKRSMRIRWADTIHGMMGEIALAHALHMEWTPGGMHIKRGDVDSDIEVRATEHADGHLLIYPDDLDDGTFVLMIGHYPLFDAVGWMTAREAKRPEWWREDADPPCWWVPKNEVHKFDREESSEIAAQRFDRQHPAA